MSILARSTSRLLPNVTSSASSSSSRSLNFSSSLLRNSSAQRTNSHFALPLTSSSSSAFAASSSSSASSSSCAPRRHFFFRAQDQSSAAPTAGATDAKADQPSSPQQPASSTNPASASSSSSTPPPPPPSSGPTVAELQQKLSESEKKVKELNDKYIRALAEGENIRNRARVEVENSKKYALTGFAKSLLEVADTLELAAGSVKQQMEGTDNAALKSLYEGVQMTEKVLQKALETNGIKKMSSLGAKFDPNFHMGLFQFEDETKEPNTVAQVLKEGYLINDRLLRAANVGTIKAKSAAPPAQ